MMINSIFGVFLLDITEEDVRRSEASKIFGRTKNSVAESLWQHSLISGYLLQENENAVVYINEMKQKNDSQALGEYYKAVIYHFKKRTTSLLSFLQSELQKTFELRNTEVKGHSQENSLRNVVRSIHIFTDELYNEMPFTQHNLQAFGDEAHLKGLFQLWLLMYKLAEKESVDKDTLKQASLVLRSYLEHSELRRFLV
jgi:hypothetical protein